MFIGVIKGLEHLLESGVIDEMPTIIALQSEYCDPLLQAVKKGKNLQNRLRLNRLSPKVLQLGSLCEQVKF
ncbi:threonine synthase [Actinobacillus equuli]|nr:threonine synthase [Actinobacillus equuli]